MYPLEFEAFWLNYPRKAEKQNCYITWKRLSKIAQKEVIVAAENYAKVMRAECRELEYMKYPKSFINPQKEIWKEFLEESKKPSDKWLEERLKKG